MFQCVIMPDEYFNISFSLENLVCASRAKNLLTLSSLHPLWVLRGLLLCLLDDSSLIRALEPVHFPQF